VKLHHTTFVSATRFPRRKLCGLRQLRLPRISTNAKQKFVTIHHLSVLIKFHDHGLVRPEVTHQHDIIEKARTRIQDRLVIIKLITHEAHDKASIRYWPEILAKRLHYRYKNLIIKTTTLFGVDVDSIKPP